MRSKPRARHQSSYRIETVPDTSSPAFAAEYPVTRVLDGFATAVTRWVGSPMAFGVAVLAIIVWIVSGPVFHFSDTGQLVINTGPTIVTFLMVFLIRQSQNKDSVAVHLKLNELLASHHDANNRLIGIENASENDLRRIAAAYHEFAEKAGRRFDGAGQIGDPVEQAHTGAIEGARHGSGGTQGS